MRNIGHRTTFQRIIVVVVALLFFVAMPLSGGMAGDVWAVLSALGQCKSGGCTVSKLFVDGTLIGWGIFLAAAGAPPVAVAIVSTWAL